VSKTAETSLIDIFNEALGHRGASEQASFLDQACGRDAVLRRKVDKLLAAERHAGGFLGDPMRGAARPVGSESSSLSERAGERIGRYKLLQQIGEGGCGVVYMAEQEEPIRRQVA